VNRLIFMSYRRDDSLGSTGRMYDHLVERFKKEKVFIDVDTIPPGDDFVEVIEKVIAKCDVFVLVIGKHC